MCFSERLLEFGVPPPQALAGASPHSRQSRLRFEFSRHDHHHLENAGEIALRFEQLFSIRLYGRAAGDPLCRRKPEHADVAPGQSLLPETGPGRVERIYPLKKDARCEAGESGGYAMKLHGGHSSLVLLREYVLRCETILD